MFERPAAQVSVVGAGGIGCALGHALRAGGVDVTFVDADEQKVDWGRRHAPRATARRSKCANVDSVYPRGDESVRSTFENNILLPSMYPGLSSPLSPNF